ncbi:hypothetical protein [Deinococcus sp.]|uniref:hypothetical protein n=1 Tax=Deinococcus sp. TaxID=47478 RepID=UPI003C7CC29F
MRPSLLALLLLTPLLGGCRYSFIPIIPPPLQVSLPTRIVAAELRREGDDLTVSATLSGSFTPDYLSVVWYDADTELGRDSVYLDNAQRAASFRMTAPRKGSYRALLSYGGVLLRQIELRETGDL